MALKKPSSPVGTSVGCLAVHSVFNSTHPNLWEWMTEEKWDDSSRRLLPSLTVFVEDGQMKLCLNDKALARVCFVSGPGFDEVMQAAEKGLAEDSLEWRKSKPQPGRR